LIDQADAAHARYSKALGFRPAGFHLATMDAKTRNSPATAQIAPAGNEIGLLRSMLRSS